MLESVTKEELALALYYVSSQLNSIGWNFGTLKEGMNTFDTCKIILKEALEFKFEYPEYCLDTIEEVLTEGE